MNRAKSTAQAAGTAARASGHRSARTVTRRRDDEHYVKDARLERHPASSNGVEGG